jgi:hypothetical protein
MNDDELSFEQLQDVEALYAELEREAARAGVDLPAATRS